MDFPPVLFTPEYRSAQRIASLCLIVWSAGHTASEGSTRSAKGTELFHLLPHVTHCPYTLPSYARFLLTARSLHNMTGRSLFIEGLGLW
jgi:hypothetical protein